uniref:Protein kinase domain-containing protein n=1 Tax=Angiostrongylus cantonensis TaxID=6313 RepID=A0A0K0DIP8_ANGCA
MASEELALKLARRLECVGETTDSCGSTIETVQPPPAPVVLPNPHVGVDDSISIDEFITKTLKRNECGEENNNVNSANLSEKITTDAHMIFLASKNGAPVAGLPPKKTLAELLAKDNADSSASQRGPPPKTTIGELVEKDKRRLSPTVVCQRPMVTIERSQKKPLQHKQSSDNDDSELQQKLAAQRMKKCYDASAESSSKIVTAASPKDSLLSDHLPEDPSTQTVSEVSIAENKAIAEDAEIISKRGSTTEQLVHELHNNAEVQNKLDGENQNKLSPSKEASSCEPKEPESDSLLAAPLEESSEKPEENPVHEHGLKNILFLRQAENAELKRLLGEEMKKCKTKVEEMMVLKDIELRKDRPFSPSKELLEMIHSENGIRSPPPVPPPKPQTPSQSRPQSPAIKQNQVPSGMCIDFLPIHDILESPFFPLRDSSLVGSPLNMFL